MNAIINHRNVEAEDKIQPLLSVLARVVRAIAKNEEVTIKELAGLPTGATDGKTVFISKGLVAQTLRVVQSHPDQAARKLSSLRGLIYHELSHLLWTDFDGLHSLLHGGWTKHEKHAWNVLEDQKIEAFLAERHPDTIKHLRVTILSLLVEDGDPATAHALLHGRRYLDQKLRRKAKAEWFDPGTADEVGELIDRYALLDHRTDVGEFQRIVHRFAEILADQDVPNVDDHDDSGGSGSDDPDSTEETRQAVAAQQDEDPEEEEPEEAPEGGGGGGGEADDESEDEDGDSAGDGPGESDETDDGDDTGETGSGTSESGADETDEDFSEALNEALSEALDDQDVQRTTETDLREFDRALKQAARLPNSKNETAITLVQVPNNGIGLPQKIIGEVRKVSKRFAPGVSRKQTAGELNVLDYRTRKPGTPFKVFDRYERDKRQAAAVEVVVLLDVSGSTHDPTSSTLYGNSGRAAGQVVDTCSIVGWAIKRAFDQLPHCRASVLGFDDGFTGYIYRPEERADRQRYKQVWAQGGTNPEEALEEAAKVFDGSNALTKLLVLVTDGQFYAGADDIIKAFGEAGVGTILAGVGGTTSSVLPIKRYGDHGAQVARDLEEPADLVKILREIVTTKLKLAAKKAHR